VNALLNSAPTWLRRSLVTLAGGILILAGVVLLVLPGPGLLVMALGLAVLATEYAAARHLLDRLKSRLPIDAARARFGRLRTRGRNDAS
jgi:uncharacterized protein (TIGR02611 family)